MGLAKTALAIGIAVLFTVFIAFGLYTVYELPKHDFQPNPCLKDYTCNQDMIDDCNEKTNFTYGRDPSCYDGFRSDPTYIACMEDFEVCVEEYHVTSDRYKHARNNFFILFVIALAAIVGGMTLSHLEGIGSGFIGGGVLLILWSLIYTREYWVQWNKYVQLLCLFIVLVLLIVLGYKKIEKHTKKHHH